MRRRHLMLGLVLVALAVVPCYLIYRDIQQNRLNRKLIAAVQGGNTTEVLTALAQGADPNAREVLPLPWWQGLLDRLKPRPDREMGEPSALALMFTTERVRSQVGTLRPENFECVKAMLAHGAHPNVSASNDSSTPLLVQVARLGYGSCVRLLVEKGANANATDSKGRNALIASIYWNDTESAKLLLKEGIDVNARFRGRTALDYARSSGKTVMANIIRQAGGRE